jgi:hypothetical protein
MRCTPLAEGAMRDAGTETALARTIVAAGLDAIAFDSIVTACIDLARRGNHVRE